MTLKAEKKLQEGLESVLDWMKWTCDGPQFVGAPKMALRNLLRRMFIVRKRKELKSTTEASNLRNWEKEYKLEERK